ncbi:TVP38/TMEM64 family protein [Magnetococcales bacterium HHB-1]
MDRVKLFRIAIFLVLVLGIVWAFYHRDQIDAGRIEQWVKDFGLLAPLIFIGVYALATVFFLPGSVLTLSGGALFGPVWGTLYNLTGATLGATLAFLAARYLASDWVAEKTGGRLKKIIQGVEEEGWKFVAFVRLVPVFPFNIINYALGLTKIRLTSYVIASFICMIPGGFAYTYLGYAGKEALAGGEGLMQKGLLALGLLALVAFLPSLIKRMRANKDEVSSSVS